MEEEEHKELEEEREEKEEEEESIQRGSSACSQHPPCRVPSGLHVHTHTMSSCPASVATSL